MSIEKIELEARKLDELANECCHRADGYEDTIYDAAKKGLIAVTEDADFEYKTIRIAVTEMRNMQKTYFKTRGSVALARSKELEAKVDRMLAGK